MAKDSKKSGSLTKVAGTVAVVVAAFLILKFVFNIVSSLFTWGLIAAVAVIAIWLFLGSGSTSKKSGPD